MQTHVAEQKLDAAMRGAEFGNFSWTEKLPDCLVNNYAHTHRATTINLTQRNVPM